MEIIGQILGFIFAYYLLRLAYKLYGKNRIPAAVLVVWASVFIMLCSLQWFQVWAKSFITSNITAKLAIFDQQVGAVQKTTQEMHDQLASLQVEIDKHHQELGEIQGKLQDAETNATTIQETTAEMHDHLANYQTQIDKHQQELDEVRSKIMDAETNSFNQSAAITNQFQQILMVRSGLAVAETNLSAQEKQLSEVKQWVNKLFGKTADEMSAMPYTNH